jgi:hypothetical protein
VSLWFLFYFPLHHFSYIADDSSRVVLKSGHDDYINASHIGVGVAFCFLFSALTGIFLGSFTQLPKVYCYAKPATDDNAGLLADGV